MPVKNDAKRALTACKALDITLTQYLQGRLPIYKLAGECERCLEDVTLLLHAIIHTSGLSKRVLRKQGINESLITTYEEMVEHVLRADKKGRGLRDEGEGEDP